MPSSDTIPAAPELQLGRGHPRPLLQRAAWTCLNGTWDFARDDDAAWRHPGEVTWRDQIVVPFTVETPASGIADTGFHKAVWYRRSFRAPHHRPGETVLLHFGAVDHEAQVWVDGCPAGSHEGGYTPFALDVTWLLDPEREEHEVIVRAVDDPVDLAKPRGKQDWELEPHSIWYPRTTGIWQTVWLEVLPRAAVTSLAWTPDVARFEMHMAMRLTGTAEEGLRVRVRLSADGETLADDVVAVRGERVERRFTLTGVSLDAKRETLMWTPEHPRLLDALVEVIAADGTVLDTVASYCALRSVGVEGGRFLLNGRPYFLRLVLDQGYWPATGMTAPDDDALCRDVQLALAMGFNGVRKHAKIEDPRYLYWADRLGLLVWAEMPAAYRFDHRNVQRHVSEWMAVLDRDRSHPCIVAWVTNNESCGTLNLPSLREEQDYLLGLVRLTRALDPHRRPVVGNDGWENLGGDIIGVHDYEQDAHRLAERYRADVLPELLTGFGVHGRQLVLDGPERLPLDGGRGTRRAVILTEFGGVGFSAVSALTTLTDPLDATVPHAATAEVLDVDDEEPPPAWGYSTVGSSRELLARYEALVTAVAGASVLAGFCYTQFADTYQECNGLLTGEREPKAPIERIAQATEGMRSPLDI